MDIITIYFVLVALACGAGIAAVWIAYRNELLRFVAPILLLFVVAAVWEEAALRTFAAREPDGMEGLLLRPAPNYDHRFTPRGEHYAKFAFVVPGATIGVAALLFLAAAIALGRPRGAAVLAASLAALAVIAGMCLLFIARFLAASTIFI